MSKKKGLSSKKNCLKFKVDLIYVNYKEKALMKNDFSYRNSESTSVNTHLAEIQDLIL